ncbi:Mur ligase family protein [Albirhodobacter sp. R86504]|uniref:Mur ligase family protein n=1 Tax=Albirhodobacter sp. R86504 TaxID=3093848 RepID=UPI00366B13F8
MMTGELIGTILLIAALGYFGWVRSKTHLAYFQQEEYDAPRYLRALVDVRLYDVQASVALAVLWLLKAITGLALFYPVLAALALVVIAWRESRYTFKKPLVMTERATRMLGLARAATAVIVALSGFGVIVALIAIQIVPFALMAANAVLQPMQQRINDGFVREATDKLAEMRPETIGITGSFGKTTVKHMLAELLGVAGPVFYSRGSINTVLGLTRHIRQRLQPSHKYFIAEMGAYGIGSIKRLCDFAQPDYGIITAVGHAHAERFGSLSNTAIAKSELAAHVCAHGKKVVVTDRVAELAPFAALRSSHPEKFVVVGEGEGCDVRILSRVLKGADWVIALRFPSGAEHTFILPLLGEHNVMNMALCVALIDAIAPDVTARLPMITPTVSQVPHRLQKKDAGKGPLILDDAYNSNEEGFVNAMRVMREVADQKGGRAVLVTPGVAELGNEHDRVHTALGGQAGQLCDVIYAVNPSRIPSFTLAARNARAEVIEVATLNDAMKGVTAMGLTAADVVLYENDLPDLLEEKRLL